MRKKLIIVITTVFLLSILTVNVFADDNVLKIGAVAPLTGPSARVGEEFEGAVEMAFAEIDNQVGDYEIEVVWIDSESETAKATQAYEMAIQREGIDVGFLSWHSWVSVGLMDICALHQIPHFFGYGATTVVNENYEKNPERYSYWLGKAWPSPKLLTTGYIETVEGSIEKGIWEPEEKKAAIYGDDTDWGRDFGEGITEQLEEEGWEVVTQQYFGKNESDFYPLLQRLKDQDVSLLAGTVGSVSAFSSFVKQAREIDLNSLIIADGLGWTGEWYDLTGDASDYIIDQIPQWTTQEAKDFRDEFEEEYGFRPSPTSAAVTYDLSKFLIKILETTYEEYGELNSTVLYEFGRENLMSGEMTYSDGIVMNEYKYTPDTWPDMVVGPEGYMFPVIQYKEGEDSVIWPDDWAEREIEIPERLNK